MEIQELIISINNMNEMLFRHTRNLMRNDEEAKDIVQDVILVLLKRREKLHDYSHVKSFAFKIADNLCLNQIKYLSYRKSIQGYAIAENIASDNTQGYDEIMKEITGILEMLPEQQQALIRLRGIGGMEIDEIVEYTGLNKNYVYVNLSRARKRIIEIIRKHK